MFTVIVAGITLAALVVARCRHAATECASAYSDSVRDELQAQWERKHAERRSFVEWEKELAS